MQDINVLEDILGFPQREDIEIVLVQTALVRPSGNFVPERLHVSVIYKNTLCGDTCFCEIADIIRAEQKRFKNLELIADIIERGMNDERYAILLHNEIEGYNNYHGQQQLINSKYWTNFEELIKYEKTKKTAQLKTKSDIFGNFYLYLYIVIDTAKGPCELNIELDYKNSEFMMSLPTKIQDEYFNLVKTKKEELDKLTEIYNLISEPLLKNTDFRLLYEATEGNINE